MVKIFQCRGMLLIFSEPKSAGRGFLRWMRLLVRRFLAVSVLAPACSLSLGACSDHDDTQSASPGLAAGGAGEEVACTDDARVDEFEEGLAKTGDQGFTVTLESGDPEPPARGDNGWSVTVLDADGKPLSDVELVVTAKMPDHGHMSPTTPEATTTDADGKSSISKLNLFMAGVWFVEVSIMAPGAAEAAKKPLDSVRFAFCVEG